MTYNKFNNLKKQITKFVTGKKFITKKLLPFSIRTYFNINLLSLLFVIGLFKDVDSTAESIYPSNNKIRVFLCKVIIKDVEVMTVSILCQCFGINLEWLKKIMRNLSQGTKYSRRDWIGYF
jgi:hypothetical protein